MRGRLKPLGLTSNFTRFFNKDRVNAGSVLRPSPPFRPKVEIVRADAFCSHCIDGGPTCAGQ
jgi:hypothetical protein